MFNEGIRQHEGYVADPPTGISSLCVRVKYGCQFHALQFLELANPRCRIFENSLILILIFFSSDKFSFLRITYLSTTQDGSFMIMISRIFNVASNAAMDDENDGGTVIIRHAIGKSSTNLRQAYLSR